MCVHRVCAFVCVCACMCACVNMYVRMYVCVNMYVRMYVCEILIIRIFLYVKVCVKTKHMKYFIYSLLNVLLLCFMAYFFHKQNFARKNSYHVLHNFLNIV